MGKLVNIAPFFAEYCYTIYGINARVNKIVHKFYDHTCIRVTLPLPPCVLPFLTLRAANCLILTLRTAYRLTKDIKEKNSNIVLY